MLKRWWNYLKTLISGGVEARMDPAVQIEQIVVRDQQTGRSFGRHL